MTVVPAGLLDDRPMHRLQVVVVALCVALNGLDGYDVLAISFAAPGIAADWGIDRAELGLVLSMELIGMAIGSILIGNLADRIGRRPTIVACLLIMAGGMLATAAATGVAMLCATRVLTGLGIGGMLASTSAMVAEYSNARRRSLNVVLNIAGYSLGAIVGGLIASALLARTGDWRTVFLLGGGMTCLMLPAVLLLMPESVTSILARRPSDALARVNRSLGRVGVAPIPALPEVAEVAPRATIGMLLSRSYAPLTLLLVIAYFAQIMLFYYLQKWTPKIVVDLGLDPAAAGRVLVWANVGALAGAVVLGLAAQRVRLRPAVIVAMLASFFAIAAFGTAPRDPSRLRLLAALAGFCINAGVVGLYPILAQTFPPQLRASGTGLVIGLGRGGSALAPLLAGALFKAGAGVMAVSLAMGAGALVAAGAVAALAVVERQRAVAAR